MKTFQANIVAETRLAAPGVADECVRPYIARGNVTHVTVHQNLEQAFRMLY